MSPRKVRQMARNDHTRSSHSAAPSLLGYIFQCRYALLDALRRVPSENRVRIALETIDDVKFEQEGITTDILQIKHHTKAQHGSLSDSSPDIWRTLQVWIDGICTGRIGPDARLFLITTNVCAEGTAAANLRPKTRCPADALRLLRTTAASSKNQKNLAVYRSFLSLDDKLRKRCARQDSSIRR